MGTAEGVQRFLDDLRIKCRENNIKIKFRRGKRVKIEDGIYGGGYFYYIDREIVVARKNIHWLAILVHESCHLDQYLENTEIWQKSDKWGHQLDNWLSGKKVKNLRKAVNSTIALELDCEKRSIKKIAYYDLPINTITYIQKANAYILYYKYVGQVRRWKPKPYDNPEIYLKMPSRFMSDSYYRKLPDKIKKIFIEQNL